jgi:hypothetical protein
LPLGRVEILQVGLRNGPSALLVHNAVYDRHRRLRENALRRHDDLELVGT